MPRPLIQKSIHELEMLFTEWQSQSDKLSILKCELENRKSRRALRLRQDVENLLVENGENHPRHPRSTQMELWPSPNNAPPRTSARRDTSPDTQSSSNDQDYLAAPHEFTLVQPIGVRPRPSTYRPELKTDVRLKCSADDSAAAVFSEALAELIGEMRRSRVGRQQFALEDGVRVVVEGYNYTYQFRFDEEANLFEGAKIDILVGGRIVSGHIAALFQGRILVSLSEDFGDHIASCVLRIDNTALLQALHDRLEAIEQGEAPEFRVELAESVLTNSGSEVPARRLNTWPWSDCPTAKQKQFVELALANEISWLWGPPGTGKTQTLSALCRLLYEDGKRVLICSNTNRAVDQLLLKLCEKMRKAGDQALDDGRVVRLGRIEGELENAFGDCVSLDRIVIRKSVDLIRRKEHIEIELERLARGVEASQSILERFRELDVLRNEGKKAKQHAELTKRELDQQEFKVRSAKNRSSRLAEELERHREAGALRRLFMRDELLIQRDIDEQHSRLETIMREVESMTQKASTAAHLLEEAEVAIRELEVTLSPESRDEHQRNISDYDSKQGPLREELSAIAARLEDIRISVLRDARLVGSTVTRSFLRPAEFASFDDVIIDEASMILLPAVYQAAGLAKDKVVIAGDFQQLPPIVQTEQQSIHDVLAPDIFQTASIGIDTVGQASRLVMLDEQFRMDDSICKIVSTTFYGGALRTHPEFHSQPFSEPQPLSERLTLIDTSSVWPFTTRNAFKSRLNLMHALAIRNLILHLKNEGRLFDSIGKCRVGVCTPYAAQAQLLRDVFYAHALDAATLRASTVHGFQGDERALMILDLVDSVGERNAGSFLQANHLNDSGAKLMNVALSRAQEGLVIVANLTFLDRKLPSDAILRGLLFDAQRLGRVVDVKDVLALYPITEDLKKFGDQPEIDAESLRTGLFDGRGFAKLCRFDMEHAKKSIVVFSGFITPERAARMGEVFRRRISDGVRVRCVTRPPNRNGTIPEELGKTALTALEALGVAIDLRNEIHEKVVLVDNQIAWFGSLNPLSHTSRTSELMARVDDAGVACHIAGVLSIRRRSSEDFERGAAADEENPRCDSCGGWSTLIRGRYGPFFRCAQGCDWKQNVDSARRSRQT